MQYFDRLAAKVVGQNDGIAAAVFHADYCRVIIAQHVGHIVFVYRRIHRLPLCPKRQIFDVALGALYVAFAVFVVPTQKQISGFTRLVEHNHFVNADFRRVGRSQRSAVKVIGNVVRRAVGVPPCSQRHFGNVDGVYLFHNSAVGGCPSFKHVTRKGCRRQYKFVVKLNHKRLPC